MCDTSKIETQEAADVIWEQTVDDGRFNCRVIGSSIDGYKGFLIVTIVKTGKQLINTSVGLSYGAKFGPDVDDVRAWQNQSLVAIDKWLEEQGEQVP